MANLLSSNFRYGRGRFKPAIAQAAKESGRIDILVNNAAITRDGIAMRMKKTSGLGCCGSTRIFQVPFAACQGRAPFHDEGKMGRLEFPPMSEEAVMPARQHVAAKAGPIGLHPNFRPGNGPRNVTANAAAPGFIDTDMTASLPEDLKTKILAGIPPGPLWSGSIRRRCCRISPAIAKASTSPALSSM
jgi:3-oxoacyl-[acyl-carrier protein] reductase